jgi:hypothetical protein
MLPSGDTFAAGDSMIVAGFAATNSGCSLATDGTGAFGCFEFWDLTKDWMVSPPSGATHLVLPQPSGGLYYATTDEYVAEWVSHTNAQYNANAVSWGLSWDISGAAHPDPSWGSDPYVAWWVEDTSSNFVNFAVWDNLTQNTPDDPMVFLWGGSQ